MKRIRRLEQVAVATAVFLPVLGSALAGRWLLLLIFLLSGGLWLARRWSPRPLATTAYLGSTLALAVAAGLEVGAGWLLLGMVGALAAWDLDAFAGRLAHVDGPESETVLVDIHLRRLALVLLLALTLSSVALLVQVDLGYGLVLLLVVLAFVALSRTVTLFRRDLSHSPQSGAIRLPEGLRQLLSLVAISQARRQRLENRRRGPDHEG
jgi:hypothetical protein